MSLNFFDADYYRADNPDLAGAGLVTDDQLQSHFVAYGLQEGRRFSGLVDLSEYSAFNPGLASAGVVSNQQLYDHLSMYGVQEGRWFSSLVDLDLYMTLNPDVKAGVGGDREQALIHLQRYGLDEGRRFSLQFSAEDYDALNPGLATAGVNTGRELLTHFQRYGIDEGRSAAEVFRLGDYRQSNADLVGLSNAALIQHFRVAGVAEGRASSERFNVRYYLDNNPDLQAAGLSFADAFEHYLFAGENQGRQASPSTLRSAVSGEGASVVDGVRYDWRLNRVSSSGGASVAASPLRLDPNKTTILLAHGQVKAVNASVQNMEALAQTAAAEFPDAQVIFLDWRNASFDPSLRPSEAGRRIGTVAQDVAQKLRDLGFEDGRNLNFYGHSLGALLLAKVAEDYGRVDGMVALDPAFPADRYDLDNDGDTSEGELPDLRAIANRSVALVVEDNFVNGIAGDNAYAATAARSYIVDFSGSGGSSLAASTTNAHNAVVNVFSNLLTQGLGPSFLATTPQILPNQWRQSGQQRSSSGSETDADGVIAARFLNGARNLRVDGLQFVNARSGQRDAIAIDQTISLQIA